LSFIKIPGRGESLDVAKSPICLKVKSLKPKDRFKRGLLILIIKPLKIIGEKEPNIYILSRISYVDAWKYPILEVSPIMIKPLNYFQKGPENSKRIWGL